MEVQREAAMAEHDGGRSVSGVTTRLRPLPVMLLDDPLEYLAADHTRNRIVTSAVARFGEGRAVRREEAIAVAGFLARDLGLHHLDEEEDLFPCLRKRSLPGDDLDPILERLEEDHKRSASIVSKIVEALSAPDSNDTVSLGRTTCKAMLTYADQKRRHLAIENAVVLVLARIRLTPKDLSVMSRHMKLRRGISV